MVSAVIWAAGQAAEASFSIVDNRPVLQGVLESALAANLDEVICVAGDMDAVRRHINMRDRRLAWLLNAAGAGGRNAALWASHPQTDGVMFLAGDRMPASPDLINALIARFERGGAWIVAPSTDGQPGYPALFHRELFGELLALTGNENERSLPERHAGQLALVDWQENILISQVAAKQRRARMKGSL